jgi:hypothetical protein
MFRIWPSAPPFDDFNQAEQKRFSASNGDRPVQPLSPSGQRTVFSPRSTRIKAPSRIS